jgi:hypothetical protein
MFTVIMVVVQHFLLLPLPVAVAEVVKAAVETVTQVVPAAEAVTAVAAALVHQDKDLVAVTAVQVLTITAVAAVAAQE